MRIPPLLSMDPLNFDTWIETQLTDAILNAKNTWNVVQLKTNNGCEKKKKTSYVLYKIVNVSRVTNCYYI